MKNFIILIVIVFLFHVEIFPQEGWFWQNPLPQGNMLLDVSIFNEDETIIVGYYSITRTADGGNSWIFCNVPLDIVYGSSSIVQPDFCYVLGYNFNDQKTTLIKSTDKGITWEIKYSVSYGLSSVYFIGRDTGWVAGVNGKVMFTTDGGTTWADQVTGITENLTAIHFINNFIGWAVGFNGKIISTTDGGNSWNIQNSQTTSTLRDVSFADSNNGWVVGLAFTVMRTTNGGITWQSQNLGSSYSYQNVQMLNNDIVLIQTDHELLKTTDNGLTWSIFYPAEPSDELIAFNFLNENFGLVVGFDGIIYNTTDGGESWENLLQGKTNQLLSVCFIDPNIGFAVGGPNSSSAESVILKTTSGGSNWFSLIPPTMSTYRSIHFIDYNTGWIAGGYYTVENVMIKTTDGGGNWIIQNTGITNGLNSVFFINENFGWSVGYEGSIVKTTNGGDVWFTQTSGTNSELESVHFEDENNGWVVGWNGLILKTTNGGSNWSILNSSTSETLYSVQFINTNVGWAVGGNGTILQTTDGGNTWMSQSSGTTQYLYSCTFINENYGWAVGTDGILISTTDGGVNWYSIQSISQQSLYSCYSFSEDKVWAVGGNGTIIHNQLITSVEEQNLSYTIPNEYALEQNYPNPFNPSTVISYQLPIGGNVMLKVFDVLGNEIATFVDEYKPAGKYEVEFNANGLSSGIYFYKLQAGSFMETKKMILMK